MIFLKQRGYALVVLLVLIVLLFILTASFSMTFELGAREARAVGAQAQALSAADSGINYALEAIRQTMKSKLDTSPNTAQWITLENNKGLSACFKVFVLSSCPAKQDCVESYGKVGLGLCSDDQQSLSQIYAARKLKASIEQNVIVKWEEDI